MARTKKETAPAVEDLELDEEADDLELEDDDEEPAPVKKKAAKAKAPAKTSAGNGVAWLAEHIGDQTGEEVTPANLRVLLRKMARDEDGPLSREVGAERARYAFTGENDKIVKAVLKAVKGGALKKAKSDGLAAAREAKANKAASGTASKVSKRSKVADDEETVTPAPKTTRKRKS